MRPTSSDTHMLRNKYIENLSKDQKDVKVTKTAINYNAGVLQFLPFFEHAEKIGCSIFIHPWEMMGQNDMQKYWLPWLVGMPAETSRAICSLIFGGVFEKYPNLKIIGFCFLDQFDQTHRLVTNGSSIFRGLYFKMATIS